MKFFFFIIFLTTVIVIGAVFLGEHRERRESQARPDKASIIFRGKPLGGEVTVLVYTLPTTVTTKPDESSSDIAAKVAHAMNINTTLQAHLYKAQLNGNRLTVLNIREHNLALCTTDPGLQVPSPPKNFRCMVEPGKNVVHFSWEKSGRDYNRIHITEKGFPIGSNLNGASTQFMFDPSLQGYSFIPGWNSFRILGVREGTPSCYAWCEVFIEEMSM